jgi:hypothetical protein
LRQRRACELASTARQSSRPTSRLISSATGSRSANGCSSSSTARAADRGEIVALQQSIGLCQSRPQRPRFAAIGPQPVQTGIAEADRRRAQESGQRQVIAGIGDRPQRVDQIANLRPIVEAASGDGHKGDSGRLEPGLIGLKTGGGPEQQRHLAPIPDQAVLAQFDQAVGQGAGGRQAGLLGPLSGAEHDLQMRADAGGGRLVAVSGQGGVRHLVQSAGFLTPHQRADQVVERRQQRRVGPEAELDLRRHPTAGLHLPPFAPEDAHIGAAEPVDALASVADREQTAWAPPGQRIDDAPLALVGVLEFIHQHRRQPLPPALSDLV